MDWQQSINVFLYSPFGTHPSTELITVAFLARMFSVHIGKSQGHCVADMEL
jgi:hypothetical protein